MINKWSFQIESFGLKKNEYFIPNINRDMILKIYNSIPRNNAVIVIQREVGEI